MRYVEKTFELKSNVEKGTVMSRGIIDLCATNGEHPIG